MITDKFAKIEEKDKVGLELIDNLSSSAAQDGIVKPVHEALDEVDCTFESFQLEIRGKLQHVLDTLAGQRLTVLATKVSTILRLRESLHRADLRVQCPSCLQPAFIDVGIKGSSNEGAYLFRHGFRTHSTPGQQPFPKTKIVDPLPKITRKARRQSRKK